MVEWSIAAFHGCESVHSIVVACPPGHEHELGVDGVTVVDGGATRAQSVANALTRVATPLVAIHDAARPLVTPALIEDTVAALEAAPGAAGAIAATPVTDTIKQAGESDPSSPASRRIESTLDRGRLWAAQTPQVFWVEALRKSLESDPETVAAATDEAMLVEATGGKVLLHPAPVENLKVTTKLDLRLAEQLLAERLAR